MLCNFWSLIFTTFSYNLSLGLAVIASVGTNGSGYTEIKTEEGLTAIALVNNVLVWVTKRGKYFSAVTVGKSRF